MTRFSSPGTRRWPLLTPPGITRAARAASSPASVLSVTAMSVLSCLVDSVLRDDVHVERDAEPGPGRHLEEAVAVDRQALLCERLVDRCVRDAVLLVERVGQHGVHVQRRGFDDPALPRVRHRLDAVLAGEGGDAHHLGDAAAAGDVGLDQVDVTALDQLPEAPDRRVLLARGDADVDRVRQLGVGLVLVGQEGLLEPEDIVHLLQLAGDADRALRVVDVPVAGVDQDRDGAGSGLDRRGRELDVLRRVLAERSPAELDRGEALVAEPTDALAHLRRVVRHQHRGVRAHLVALLRAEQLAHRLALRLALDVPERDVDAADRVQRDPAAADVDQAAVHLLPEPLDVRRILTDEQVAEAVRDRVRARRLHQRAHRLGRGVDLADAGDALVRVDEDDEIVLAAVGDGVVERGLAEDDRLHVSDLHRRPPRMPIVNYRRDCLQSRRLVDSPVHCTLDLDAPGKNFGRLEVPRSTNTAGWSHLFVPIVTGKGGDGPTGLVLGGVHGDEPEGQIAALRLARETDPGDVEGRLIVIPCASLEASHANTRLWPSGANFNRSFPGRPDGPLDEQLSDFITRALIDEADIVIDMHSGGNSSLFGVWSEMHWVDEPEQRKAMVGGMLAWLTPMHFVYIDVAGTGLLTGEAEQRGKIVVATELGGGGHVLASTHRIAIDGLRNVLRHFGVLAGEVQTRESLGLGPPVIVRATDQGNYLFAPDAGHWETLVDVGEHVTAGQLVGRVHFIDRPDRDASEVIAPGGGVVCVVRAIAPCLPGDNVLVIGRQVDVSELS